MGLLSVLKIVYLLLSWQNILIIGDSEACSMKFGAITTVRQPTEMVMTTCKNGTRTAYWEGTRMDAALSMAKFDIVIVFLGTNDYGMKPDPTKIAQQIEASGAKCVWVGPPLVRGKRSVTNEHLKSNVAPCVYLDTQALNIPLIDGVHPTNAGAVKWLKSAWDLKNSLLPKSQPLVSEVMP